MTTTTATIEPSVPSVNHSTRILCSKVLLDPDFADMVFETLCVRRIRTLAPSPGIDHVVLARHAAWALEQRRHRHLVVAMLLIVVLVSLPVLILSLEIGAILAGGTALGATLWAVADQARVDEMAVRIIDEGVIVDLGRGLIDAADERRLAAVNDANLSIYARALDDDPFPGAGQRVDVNVTPTLDISKAKDDTRPVGEFTAYQLLEHLARTMPKHISVGGINDSCDARLVLYVRGTHVRALPDLLPGREGAPLTSAPGDLLRDFTNEPTGYARTYLRAQIVGHRGGVVTTFHITGVVSPLGLSLDFALHVLRPIHWAYSEADLLPRTSRDLMRNLASQGDHLRRLMYAPLWAWRTHQRTRRAGQDARLSPAQLAAVGTQDFYGTHIGLREATSFLADVSYNRRVDIDRQFNDLIAAAFLELEAFLESLNIDTTEWNKKRASIVQNFVTAYHKTINGVYHEGLTANNVNIGGNLDAGIRNLPNLRTMPVPDDGGSAT